MHTATDAILDADFSVKYLKSGSSDVDKLVEVFNQMIDILRSERIKMSEQSYFIQKLIEVTPVGIIILDFDDNISSYNPFCKDIFNFENDVIGKPFFQIEFPLVKEISKIAPGHAQIISANGIEKYKCQINEVIHQGFKRKFILIDNLSKEILETEKNAFGKIIRMMAHEVNNSIGAINSIIDSVSEFGFESEDDPLKSSLMLAKDRNIALNKFMANYASILRLPDPTLVKMDLVPIVKKIGRLYVPIAEEKNIDIAFDLPFGPISIKGDEVLLEQALTNMIKNSIEAIGENGKIILTCSESPTILQIKDNGSGISDKHIKKLFTPFFSSKPTGQGVGLMLIKDILLQHHTEFSLTTDWQIGWTTFEVRFPM